MPQNNFIQEPTIQEIETEINDRVKYVENTISNIQKEAIITTVFILLVIFFLFIGLIFLIAFKDVNDKFYQLFFSASLLSLGYPLYYFIKTKIIDLTQIQDTIQDLELRKELSIAEEKGFSKDSILLRKHYLYLHKYYRQSLSQNQS